MLGLTPTGVKIFGAISAMLLIVNFAGAMQRRRPDVLVPTSLFAFFIGWLIAFVIDRLLLR